MENKVVDLNGNPVTLDKEGRKRKEEVKHVVLDAGFDITKWTPFGSMVLVKREVLKRDSGLVTALGDSKENLDGYTFTVIKTGHNVNENIKEGMEVKFNGNFYLVHKESADVAYLLLDSYTIMMYKQN